MKTLSAAAILEKNKIASGEAWLLLCEIAPVGGSPLRLVKNNEDVVWPAGGNLWLAYPFSLDPTTDDGSGRVYAATLRVSNVARLLEYYLQQTNGLDGATVTMRLVHSAHLDLATPERELVFEVLGAASDAHWATLELGLPNPLAKRFPDARYNPRYCRWHFRDMACGFTGGTNTGTTISFAAPSTINDPSAGFDAGFAADRRIRVSGSAANNGEYVIATASDSQLVLDDTTIVTEGTGAAVTIEVICPKTLDVCLANGRGAYFGGSPGVERETRT
jgi:phage-related protein